MRYCCVAFFIILLFTSCDYFSSTKKNKNHEIDTIIDFSKVDVSPSFNICKNLMNEAKTNCFRKEIQQRITKELQLYNFVSKKLIDEVVLIDLQINKRGEFELKNISFSKNIKEHLPKLDSVIKKTIKKLPIITPGFKRGIPVSTQYELPIRIQIEEEIN